MKNPEILVRKSNGSRHSVLGGLKKKWAVIWDDAILLPFIICSIYIVEDLSPTTSNFIAYVYAQDFHQGGLCE